MFPLWEHTPCTLNFQLAALPNGPMHVIAKHLLHDFCEKHADAKREVEAWISVVEQASWNTPHELRQWDVKASFLGGTRTIFNIRRNKYRLEALVDYERKIVLVKWVGTHAEYERRVRA